jgi:polar amino acid transport system substrate-binding protein
VTARLVLLFVTVAAGGLLFVAPRAAARPAADPATDLLSRVQARGTLVLSTDPAYPPQSYAVKGAKRLAATRCAVNQLTANQVAGYDADTAKLVAKALAVEPCFVTPTWSELISGHWSGRWDIAFGSIGITYERMRRLFYTQPYSAEAERFFVRKRSPVTRVEQLSGKRLGGCGGCFAQYYIQRTLRLPGEPVRYHVASARFVGYDVESNGLVAVAGGKLDGFLCGVAVGAKAINGGLALRAVGGDQYVAYISGAVDRFSGLSVGSFVSRVNAVVRRLQTGGTLRRLSLHYFGVDFATKARSFDVSRLNQGIH